MEAIKESMSQLTIIFNQKLADFEERQQKLSTPRESASTEGNLGAEFSLFKTFTLSALRALQSQVELLAQQTDNLEMHTRRKILLVHGVPEDKKEDAVAVIVKLVSQTLKLSVFQAQDVVRCHRMGRLPSSDRPRPILFKVRDMPVRAKIWAAKSGLKGTGITLSEFLTKSRHDTFMAARQRFGVSRCWTRDGSVFVLGADGARNRISCLAELSKIGVPPPVAVSEPGCSSAVTKALPVNERARRPKPKLNSR